MNSSKVFGEDPPKTPDAGLSSSAKHPTGRKGGTEFGIIGDGRVARHLVHYFTLKKIPHQQWSRRQAAETGTAWSQDLKDCPTLLLAVSDRAIEPLAHEIRQTPGFQNRTLIHFSGALVTRLAWSYHPLMTFAQDPYSLETYERIPFIGETDAPDFREIFPGLSNPFARLDPAKKALYHAWCVMGGNFTAFLWGRMFEAFERELGLAPELATPYLGQVAENLFSHLHEPRSTWTGPILRGDHPTIQKHLDALQNDLYHPVYKAFVQAFSSPTDLKPKRGTSV